MAKTLAAALATHLAQQATTIATCIQVVRRDGVRYALTNHDRDLVVNAVTYSSVDAPVTVSAVKAGSDLTVDDSEAEGLITAVVTAADIRAGKLDGARFSLFRVNWQSPGDGTIDLQKGEIGEIDTSGQVYRIEFRGRTQKLQANFIEVTSLTCRASLFDDRCKLDPDDFEEFGQIASLTSNVKFIVSNSSQGTDQSATLTNPGAEVGDLSGWTTSNVLNDATNVRSGTRSFRLGAGSASAYQDVSITGAGVSATEIDTGLVTIDFKGWVFTDGSDEASTIYVEFLDGSSNLISSTPVAPLFIETANLYQRRRIVERVPANARTARIYFAREQGSSFIWWDDFSVDFLFGQPLANLGGLSDHYDSGLIRFTSGDAKGEAMEIRTLNVGTREVEIFIPVGALAVGDQFLIYPGCKRRMLIDCLDKFHNILNARVEHYTVGKDATLASPDADT